MRAAGTILPLRASYTVRSFAPARPTVLIRLFLFLSVLYNVEAI
jgi:hypothetical protein